MKEKDISSSNEIKIYPPRPHQGSEIGMSETTHVRDDRIDSAKFWLITLVIAAHVFLRKEFADSTACTVVCNWIVIFAMPLFVFISGYFSRKKNNYYFRLSIWKLLEPLIFFQFIALLLYKNSISIKGIITPWFMLWYLLSLIYWRLLLQIIPDKILRHKKVVIIISFCISILAGFLPFDRVLSLQRTLAFLPFFFLGYYMRGKNLYLPGKYKPLCLFFLLIILTFLFFYPYRISDLHNATPYKSIYGVAIRIVGFVLAIPMSIAFLNVSYNTSYFARQGRMSMQYYIYHALIIPVNTAPVIPLLIVVASNLNLPMSFATAIFIIMGTTLGIYLVLRIPYVRFLTNPSIIFFTKSKYPTL